MKLSQRTILITLSTVISISIALLLASGKASAYNIGGEHYSYAAPSGVIDKDSFFSSSQTSVYVTGESSGTTGAVAHSNYFADLSTGRVGTYVYGYSPHADEYNGGSASVTAYSYFNDTLNLTIPEGSYPDGLFTTMHGFVNGRLGASGCNEYGTNCSNVYEVGTFALGGGLGGDSYTLEKSDTIVYADEPGINISDTFDLTVRIAQDGADFSSDQDFALSVSASLKGKGGAHNFYPGGDTTSSVVSDFYTTGGFSSFDVPEGVTWTSDSGVFLSSPPVVPEPVSSTLFVAGGTVFGIRRYLRKRKS